MRASTIDLRARYYDFKQPGFIKPKNKLRKDLWRYEQRTATDMLLEEANRRGYWGKKFYHRWLDWALIKREAWV